MAARRKRLTPTVKGRIWVDIAGVALTDAGADLLEQIDACGSLSEAARRLHFAYRRAWLLLDGMNKAWPQPLVITATGGRRGGGARLTDLGRQVLRSYRDLQIQFQHFLDLAGGTFAPLGAGNS
jgi:molybdate transport system regulatory protein